MPNNIIELKGIKKFFGGVKALDGVDFSVKRGEVHCLAGENGSGKSTIIKVISGFYQPDAGEIKFGDELFSSLTPLKAIEMGIQVIYQDFSLFPNLTVGENLAINKVVFEKKRIITQKEKAIIAKKALKKINFEIDLDELVENLAVADKQLIAIARALMSDAKLIVMDEPTTALTSKEIKRLFEIVETLKSAGVTVIFVSHKLDEVYSICDNITILRNGKNVISCEVAKLTEEEFIYHMTGRRFQQTVSQLPEKQGETILELTNVSAPGFDDVSFQLSRGEILGISGQLGSGRTELALTLFGMNPHHKGELFIKGKKASLKTPAEAMRNKIAMVPEDRLSEGLFLPQSIIDNITVSSYDEIAVLGGIIGSSMRERTSAEWVDKMGVMTADHRLPVSTLSGGNQQKVVLARWLATGPEILVLNGPTVGVDIGAKYDIHQLLREAAAQGMAVIIVSDDAREIAAICHRALIMEQGKIVEEVGGADLLGLVSVGQQGESL